MTLLSSVSTIQLPDLPGSYSVSDKIANMRPYSFDLTGSNFNFNYKMYC